MNREEQRTVFPFPTADFQLKQVQGEGWDLVFFGFGFGFFWILFFVFFLNYLFIYFWLCWVFVSVRGLSPAAASGGHSPPRCAGPLTAAAPPPSCGAQSPDAQAQQPWPTGPATPRHAGSSLMRARTRVPCTGRQTLNHCATREAQAFVF